MLSTQQGRLVLNTDSGESVTTAEAKTHLNVEHSADDTYIDTLIAVARKQVENDTQRSLINTTWDLYLDTFPATIYAPRNPLSSVTSIVYTDVDGNSDTVSSSVYTVNTYRIPGEIYEAYNQNWPTDVRGVPDAVRVRFVAGFGAAASSVPTDYKHAIKLLVAHWYANREAVVIGTIVEDLPLAYQSLVSRLATGVYR